MNGGTVQEKQLSLRKRNPLQIPGNRNRKQKLKFTYKEQKEFDTIDDDIAALEERLEQIDKEMVANATNAGKLRSFPTSSRNPAEAGRKMDRWVYLNDLAEQIENQKE